jgi:hypothetical protein
MTTCRAAANYVRTVSLVAIVGAALALASPAWSASEPQQARAIANRIVALYKTPAGLCKLGTVAGAPCTAKVKAELAPLFKTYAAEIRAIGLKSLRQVAPHRYRSPLGTFAGKKFALTLRVSNGRWQLLDEDTGEWFTIPAWLAG